MQRRTAGRRARLLAVTALAAGALGAAAELTGALEPLELATVDARFAIRGERKAPDDIVLVALDGETLARLRRTPPLPRTDHGRLLRIIAAAEPRVIAEDFQFIGPKGPVGDRALLDALTDAKPVVLATHDVPGTPLGVPAGRTPESVGAIPATVELLNDHDGKIRRVEDRAGRLKTFPVVIAERLTGRRVDPDKFPAWIDYRGPPGTFRTYSFADVLDGAVPPEAFRGKVVIVGATDPIQKDIFPTPASSVEMPGVELHANAVATIRDGFGLDETPWPVDALLIVLLATTAPLLVPRTSMAVVLGVAAGMLVLLLVGAQLAFSAGWIIPVTGCLIALVTSTGGSVATELLTVGRDRARLRQAFARFVPEQVIEEVVAQTDEDLRLGGVTLEATVVFCDLRGFSTFAEANSAATVIEALNRYLAEVSEAVFAHGGTVVAFLGDGVMAVFGAPIEQPDHARRALAAAREILNERLPRFNAWCRESGVATGFEIGIGVSSGPVRSGNVGSQRRLEYAAVGDTTNVAARLQTHSKETPYQVLLTGATQVLIGADDDLVPLGKVALRGRTRPVEVWALRSSANEAAAAS